MRTLFKRINLTFQWKELDLNY